MSVHLAWLTEAPWLDRQRVERYPKLFFAIFAIAAVVWLTMGEGLLDPSGKPIGTDFIVFFTASAMALAGDAAAIFDGAAVLAAERAVAGSNAIEFVPWLYPPAFLMVVAPLALLPYGWALAAWLAATLAGYLAVIRRIAPASGAMWLAVAFPAVLINMGHGQNGFLTMALMGAAVLLADRRPWAAGLLFGALAIKPQLAILVPLALVACGNWRAVVAAGLSVASGIGLAWALFGAGIFTGFLANSATLRDVMEGVGWHKLQSVLAAARLMGAGAQVSYVAQGIAAVAAAAALAWVWRRKVSLPVRGAALVAATLLATPFYFDYDLVLLALPIAWLGWDGYRGGFLSWEKSVLVVAWLWPLIAREAALAMGVSLTPVVVAGLLALAVRRAALSPARERQISR